jgi:transglutaminase-like putative cysteine protease
VRLLRIDHLTEYAFGAEVELLPHQMLVRPRESHGLRIVSSKLNITPTATVRWQRDVLDNSVATATFTERAALLRIESSVVVEHYEESPLDFVLDEHATTYPFAYSNTDATVLGPHRLSIFQQDRPAIEDWLVGLGLRAPSIETFVLLDRINRTIHEGFRYQAREEAGVQSPAYTLAHGTGSCRDFATLFMEACRQLGLASRFVSGYLYTPMLWPGSAATHAWAEVFLPGAGWTGFDPTTGQVTGASHIAVAVAHYPEEVPPVAGSFVGTPADRPTLTVSVHVQLWHE